MSKTNSLTRPSLFDIIETRQPGIKTLEKKLLKKLSKHLHINDILNSIVEKLTILELNTAVSIINTFGGGTHYLVEKLSYGTPSTFILEHHEITMKLIKLSRHILKMPYTNKYITTIY